MALLLLIDIDSVTGGIIFQEYYCYHTVSAARIRILLAAKQLLPLLLLL
jgi:hypothetical protein